MPIEPLLKKYFLDYADLEINQQKYVSDCLNLWYLSGLLKTVYESQGGADFDTLADGATVACSVRTGNVKIDRGNFEREVESFERFGPATSFATHGNEVEGSRFNLSLAVGLGFQVEFCLSDQTRDCIREAFEAAHSTSQTLSEPKPGENPPQAWRPELNLSFAPGTPHKSWHHYWAESLAAFSIKTSREQLQKIDPKIHALLNELVLQAESKINSNLKEVVLNNRKELLEANEHATNLLD